MQTYGFSYRVFPSIFYKCKNRIQKLMGFAILFILNSKKMLNNIKIKSNELQLYESILNIIKSQNWNSITSKEIFTIINKKEKNKITKNKITRILTRLKNSWIIEKTNINIKYVTDSKSEDPLYGKSIPKQYSKYFSLFLDDAKNNEELWQLLKNKLESLINESDIDKSIKEDLILKVKSLETSNRINSTINNILIILWDSVHLLFKIYTEIIEEMIVRWLYNNHKEYWILTWQNTANQYSLPK